MGFIEREDREQGMLFPEGQSNKRLELQNAPQNALFNFINTELLPHLKKLGKQPGASARQKVISEIMSGVERVRIDTEKNFQDVLDKVDQLTAEAVDPTHVFTLPRYMKGCCSKWERRGTTVGSSSPLARSLAGC